MRICKIFSSCPDIAILRIGQSRSSRKLLITFCQLVLPMFGVIINILPNAALHGYTESLHGWKSWLIHGDGTVWSGSVQQIILMGDSFLAFAALNKICHYHHQLYSIAYYPQSMSYVKQYRTIPIPRSETPKTVSLSRPLPL